MRSCFDRIANITLFMSDYMKSGQSRGVENRAGIFPAARIYISMKRFDCLTQYVIQMTV